MTLKPKLRHPDIRKACARRTEVNIFDGLQQLRRERVKGKTKSGSEEFATATGPEAPRNWKCHQKCCQSRGALKVGPKVPQRCAEVPQRCPRGAAEVPQRCPRGAPEVPQRCPRGAAEVPQRCPRGAPQVARLFGVAYRASFLRRIM